MANRTERALKKQARCRMAKCRDEKHCLVEGIEGVFTPYCAGMKDRPERIKELNRQIKAERRDKHTIYSHFIEVNKNISNALHTDNSVKEEIGA